MRPQRNSRPGTRREITLARCRTKPEMTRERSGAGTVARTHVPHPGARTNLAREKNTPRTVKRLGAHPSQPGQAHPANPSAAVNLTVPEREPAESRYRRR